MTLADYDGHHVGHGIGREEPIVIGDTDRLSKDIFVIPSHYARDISSVLIPRGLINDRIERLAYDILQSHTSGEPLHLICILKGSRGFFNQLISVLSQMYQYSEGRKQPPFIEYYVRLKKDPIHKGHIQAVSDDLTPIIGKSVVILEDLVISGNTLRRFCRQVLDLKPKSLRVATLLEMRRSNGTLGFKADFTGFSVPEANIVGYCIDLRERYRDLEHISVLTEEAFHSH